MPGIPMNLEQHTTERFAPPGEASPVRSIFTLAPGKDTPPRRIALVGNYLPRKCGIATFTSDIFRQLGQFQPNLTVDV
jgi:hypothetical protein